MGTRHVIVVKEGTSDPTTKISRNNTVCIAAGFGIKTKGSTRLKRPLELLVS